MPATPVYIICSPRPQVGKTLVARLLTEFLLLKNGKVLAFDVNLKEPTLLDYLPDVTETAEIENTYGKMQLMDRIIVDDGGKPARIRDFWLIPAAYVASLALFLATYYMVHAELFGTTVL